VIPDSSPHPHLSHCPLFSAQQRPRTRVLLSDARDAHWRTVPPATRWVAVCNHTQAQALWQQLSALPLNTTHASLPSDGTPAAAPLRVCCCLTVHAGPWHQQLASPAACARCTTPPSSIRRRRVAATATQNDTAASTALVRVDTWQTLHTLLDEATPLAEQQAAAEGAAKAGRGSSSKSQRARPAAGFSRAPNSKAAFAGAAAGKQQQRAAPAPAELCPCQSGLPFKVSGSVQGDRRLPCPGLCLSATRERQQPTTPVHHTRTPPTHTHRSAACRSSRALHTPSRHLSS
jgi:hypothetical protein